MKIAYFDCISGISGDMTLGALVDLGIDLALLQSGIDSLGLPNVQLEAKDVKKKGFRATKVTVHHEEEHAHRHLHHIDKMIDESRLSENQKSLAKSIFLNLGKAEAKVHGSDLQKVHFHEVGAADSISDIVGTAIGLDLLGVDKIVVSPVPTGSGTIEIAHGRVSVPAPATAELLANIPLASCDIPMELTTPTGAAIVATVADGFGAMPAMTIEKVGYGAGDRDLEQQGNVLRIVLGSDTQSAVTDQVWILETNLDDVSGELIGYCVDELMAKGALDAYTTAIQMKKNRPATKVTVLCEVEKIDDLEKILFRETATLGVRRWPASRHKLAREQCQVTTPWGEVTGKVAIFDDGTRWFAPEHDSCRQIAQANNVPLREVYEAAKNQARND